MNREATLDLVMLIVTHAVLGLVRGEDVTRWARHLEAALRELRAKERQP